MRKKVKIEVLALFAVLFVSLAFIANELLKSLTCETFSSPTYPDFVSCSPDIAYTRPLLLTVLFLVQLFVFLYSWPKYKVRKWKEGKVAQEKAKIEALNLQKIKASMTPAEWAAYQLQLETNKKMEEILKNQKNQNYPKPGYGVFKNLED
jgi:hypothetical protein